jgi:hypothetical protein
MRGKRRGFEITHGSSRELVLLADQVENLPKISLASRRRRRADPPVSSRIQDQVMTIEMFPLASWLNDAGNEAYFTSAIPHQRDEEIAALIDAWLSMAPLDRQVAASRISESQRSTLLTYGVRAASLAVRECKQEHSFHGLLALGLDGWRHDWRDNVMGLALHFDAALKLGCSPEKSFNDAAAHLSLKAATAFRSFLNRPPEARTLTSMGYIESSDVNGFRYKRTW